jgi:hypothetical protein
VLSAKHEVLETLSSSYKMRVHFAYACPFALCHWNSGVKEWRWNRSSG